MEAMDTYAEAIRQWNATQSMAFATSAMRNAANGKQFVADVKERTGIEINVISGAEEAGYIYEGVKGALSFNESNSLIIDIGGGSTEFIIANKDGLKWKQSFEVGASRLLQKFKPSDPITTDEIHAITWFLNESLLPLRNAIAEHGVEELIGASGSFESLAEMVIARYGLEQNDSSTEFTFDLDQCEIIHRELLASTREQRLHIRGLVAMRVDMIVISAILVDWVIREFSIQEMRMSAYALKEGVLRRFLSGG
jgi:exopolyphosphatase/guanosine-5'-triphosphate,3'-diphosphate pyrophosphatase